ncbi:hypothetical protein D6C93_06429 [Aureobasidium pullulans]|nr:hypothetical protein D6C93_06429 [Aureobasidium pullulans]
MLDPGKDCEVVLSLFIKGGFDGLTPDQIKVIIQEESVKIENGSYTAASPTVISPAATSPAVTLLAVASLATASALMDDPDAARLKLGNLVKEIIAGQATVTKLKGAGEQAIRGLEEARKSMAHAELMVQKSMEELKGVGDALERANTIAGDLKVVHARMADDMSPSARTSARAFVTPRGVASRPTSVSDQILGSPPSTWQRNPFQ